MGLIFFFGFTNIAFASSAQVADWKFDDGSGTTALNSASSTNNGTLNGSTLPSWQISSQCHSGQCLSFDGSHSYVGVGNVTTYDALSSGTIDLWFKVTGGAGTFRTLLSYSAANSSKNYDYLIVGINSSNKIYFNIRNSAGTQVINAYPVDGLINLNQWYNVAITVGSGGNTLFLNGVAQTLAYTSGSRSTQSFFSAISTYASLYMGTTLYQNSLTNYFAGSLDEVQIYNAPLTSGQIMDIYNTGSTASTIGTMIGVNNFYNVAVGETTAIHPTCSDLTGAVTYSSSDSQYWDSGMNSWTFTPIFEDGGTINNLAFTCTNGANSISASTTVTTYQDFSGIQKYTGNPIRPYGAGSYNANGADAPYIRGDQSIGGTYYSITQANPSGSNWSNLALYTSTDLTAWTPYAGNPVLATSTSQWDDHYLGHPSVIKIGDVWYMYYSGKNSSGIESVGLATSTDFIHWTKYASNPIISPNVAIPNVIKIGSTYYMYVANRPSGHTITYYTSSDGIIWTLGGTAIDSSSGGADWDASNYRLNDPFVIKNSVGFYEMVYTAEFFGVIGTPYTSQTIGYAISSDGRTWHKKSDGPILQGSGVSGSFDQNYPGDAFLYPYENQLRLYYAGAGASGTQGGFGWIVSPTTGVYQSVDSTIYADGATTYSSSPNGLTSTTLSIAPSSGSVTVSVSKWHTSGDYAKEWTATGQGAATTVFTIGDLQLSHYYTVSVDGVRETTQQADANGRITYTYTGGWSTHTFDVAQSTDVTAPVITLNGASTITQYVGQSFTDPDATATDNIDGSVVVTTSGSVDTSKAGTYTLTYSAVDSSGNTAQVTRTVVIQNVGNGAPVGLINTFGSGPPRAIISTVPATTTTGQTTSSPTTHSPEAAHTTPAAYQFINNLSYRATGPDVLKLQQYLNTCGFVIAQSGAGSPGKETSYFGLLTYKTLIKFQEAHAADILTPNGLTKGTGYFGPSTRAFVNEPI